MTSRTQWLCDRRFRPRRCARGTRFGPSPPCDWSGRRAPLQPSMGRTPSANENASAATFYCDFYTEGRRRAAPSLLVDAEDILVSESVETARSLVRETQPGGKPVVFGLNRGKPSSVRHIGLESVVWKQWCVS